MKKTRTLYKLRNDLGTWYVLAGDANTAIAALQGLLSERDFGFSGKREVYEIEVVTHEIGEDIGSAVMTAIGSQFMIASEGK